MKRTALALLAAAGLAVTTARADRVTVHGSINVGGPAYAAPGYGYGPGSYRAPGYWRDMTTKVWIPGHWDMARDYYGHPVRRWNPGHYEFQTRRVWVDAIPRHDHHDRWEHSRRGHDRRDGWNRWGR